MGSVEKGSMKYNVSKLLWWDSRRLRQALDPITNVLIKVKAQTPWVGEHEEKLMCGHTDKWWHEGTEYL